MTAPPSRTAPRSVRYSGVFPFTLATVARDTSLRNALENLRPPQALADYQPGFSPNMEGRMLANWITMSRFPLLLITVLILYFGSPWARLAGVGLLFLGLMLDTVDGVVARMRGESSLFGSVLDIAADRTYELI